MIPSHVLALLNCQRTVFALCIPPFWPLAVKRKRILRIRSEVVKIFFQLFFRLFLMPFFNPKKTQIRVLVTCQGIVIKRIRIILVTPANPLFMRLSQIESLWHSPPLPYAPHCSIFSNDYDAQMFRLRCSLHSRLEILFV